MLNQYKTVNHIEFLGALAAPPEFVPWKTHRFKCKMKLWTFAKYRKGTGGKFPIFVILFESNLSRYADWKAGDMIWVNGSLMGFRGESGRWVHSVIDAFCIRVDMDDKRQADLIEYKLHRAITVSDILDIQSKQGEAFG